VRWARDLKANSEAHSSYIFHAGWTLGAIESLVCRVNDGMHKGKAPTIPVLYMVTTHHVVFVTWPGLRVAPAPSDGLCEALGELGLSDPGAVAEDR
jgi:hypothetical protein